MRRCIRFGILFLFAFPVLALAQDTCSPTPITCPAGQQLFAVPKSANCATSGYQCKPITSAPATPTPSPAPTPNVVAPVPASAPKVTTTPTASAQLSIGARGSTVTFLQIQLIVLGFLSSGNSTGYFGSLTQAAVRAFQSSHGIVTSGNELTTGYGLVGPRTKAALATAIAAISTGNNTSVSQASQPIAASSPSPTISTITTSNANSSLIQSITAQMQSLEAQIASILNTNAQTQTQIQTQVQTQITPQSCTLNGLTIASGASQIFYSDASLSFGDSCNNYAQTRTCTNGTLSGDSAHQFSSCTVGSPNACSFNNQSIVAGASVTAYQTQTVPYGQSCASMARTCSNGTLTGDATYQYATCTPASAPACTPLASQTQTLSCPAGQTGSDIQTRTSSCATTTSTPAWSAWTDSSNTCTPIVATPQSCTTPWSASVASGSSVVAYQSSVVAAGTSCVSQTRTCTNGTLSGSYTNSSCTVQQTQTPSTLCPIASYANTSQDASNAIQTCLNAAGTNGIVDLPAGSYTIQNALTINQPLTLRTYGKKPSDAACSLSDPTCAQLIGGASLGGAVPMVTINAGSITVDHIIFNGNKDVRGNVLPLSGQYLTVQASSNCTSCSFTNSVVKNTVKVSALDFSGSIINTTISNNIVAYNGLHDQLQRWSDGLDIGDGSNSTITNNTFIDNTDGDFDAGGCISCTITGNSITHTGTFSGSSYSAMVFQAFVNPATNIPATSGSFAGSDISHNTINCGTDRCGFGIYVGLRPWNFTPPVKGGTFHDNTITGAQQGIAIDSTITGMHFYNNTVTNSGGTFLTSGGLRATTAYNVATGAQVDFTGDTTPASSYAHTLWDVIPNWYTQDWMTVSGAGPGNTVATSGAPAAPTSLAIICNNNATATFNWTPSSGATGYYLFVVDTTIANQYIGANSPSSYTYSVNPTTITVPVGHPLTAWVYAYNASGQSSATVSNATCTS